MKDNNQLPEPELGYIQTDKSNQPAFSARQMREAMGRATQQADVTDADIDAVTVEQWGEQIGVMLQAHRAYARAILALRPERAPMTGDQWTDVLGSAGPDLLDLAKQWADNKVHVYQVVNEAEKIVKAAVLRGITAQAKKETP